MNLFAGEQMPDHVESAIDLTIQQMMLIQIKTYINQLLTQINNKTLFIRLSLSEKKLWY